METVSILSLEPGDTFVDPMMEETHPVLWRFLRYENMEVFVEDVGVLTRGVLHRKPNRGETTYNICAKVIKTSESEGKEGNDEHSHP